MTTLQDQFNDILLEEGGKAAFDFLEDKAYKRGYTNAMETVAGVVESATDNEDLLQKLVQLTKLLINHDANRKTDHL